MNNSLVSFLERRKKSTVKTATLLQQTDEVSQDEKSEFNSDEAFDDNSEHDDEWKVSDDEVGSGFQATPAVGAGLMKIVQTVACDEQDEKSTNNEQKVSHQVWPRKEEETVKEEAQPAEEPSKIWVPKFKSAMQSTFVNKNDDIDLAESAKLAFAKSEAALAAKKTKKKKKPTSMPEEDEETSFVKIKFDIFSIMDEKYAKFNGSTHTMDEELVKSKYVERGQVR
ncbi:conserved hypothetical protein [Theileria equi strain WA]|uniref:Uncharacterized protein n=1 Tax=Theileria equi strain WA TaxID=1537102 RepID=L1LBZ0_THEEQ|nr:conserved hypothetical protein [Theileria equi strain WA]EKX72851.1 conserved hypothetical protein [Theileria equi strain WA]|eukprot:XP_004832303.1 conserved hypothetical protein [Theileria equi strain WA]